MVMDGTAGLHTWSNKVMSGLITPPGSCSNFVAEVLSPFVVGSCCCPSQQGGTGLELGAGLASLSMDPMVSDDPQDTSSHSTKSAKLLRGPSPDNCSLVVVFKPAYRKKHRQSSSKLDRLVRKRESSKCSSRERLILILIFQGEN